MLSDILERIDSRLHALDLTESRAAVLAGLSDSAIRDMRRAVKAGKVDGGVSSRTLLALAPILQCPAEWLLTGRGGPTQVSGEAAIKGHLRQIDGLPEEAVNHIWRLIDGYIQDAASRAQSPPQSEPSTRHHAKAP